MKESRALTSAKFLILTSDSRCISELFMRVLRQIVRGPFYNFTISQLTSSLKWHRLTCLLLPLISTAHASALREVFIISLNSAGFIAKGCLSPRLLERKKANIFSNFDILLSGCRRLSRTTFSGLLWKLRHIRTVDTVRNVALEILFLAL